MVIVVNADAVILSIMRQEYHYNQKGYPPIEIYEWVLIKIVTSCKLVNLR